MTTSFGTDPSYVYRFKQPTSVCVKPIDTNTIYSVLSKNSQCKDFFNIIKSNPYIASKFKDVHASYTIFVPITKICLDSYNIHKTRQFIMLHTIDRVLSPSFMNSSEKMYIFPKQTGERILVENTQYHVFPILNHYVHILGIKLVGDSIIYFVNKPLSITNNPLSSVDI